MNKVLFFCALALTVSCKSTMGGASPSPPPGVAVATMTVTSSAFPPNGPIPIDFTCDGKDVLPQLTWSAPPANARSLVLMVDDPDAASGLFTHYIVFNISPELRQVKEGTDPAEGGARLGSNDFDNVRYNGPCPPKGDDHRYRYIVLAADTMLKLPEGAHRADVDNALAGHLVGEGALAGHFSH